MLKTTSEFGQLDQYKGKNRKGLTVIDAFCWNVEKLGAYLSAIERLSNDHDVWNSRERREVVKSSIRSQYCLGWANKSHKQPLYRQVRCDSASHNPLSVCGMMEHSIPVSQWTDIVLSAYGKGEGLFIASYFLAWMSPIALITKAHDKKLTSINKNLSKPFDRYRDSRVIVARFDGSSTKNITLRDHFDMIQGIGFVNKITHQFGLTQQLDDALELALTFNCPLSK